ncbi:MAG: hypothetical protein RMI79_00425, partial [Nitrososphaerota archaeon]|nr:hypothetical protein [Nitrososphaerota archaeon]
ILIIASKYALVILKKTPLSFFLIITVLSYVMLFWLLIPHLSIIKTENVFLFTFMYALFIPYLSISFVISRYTNPLGLLALSNQPVTRTFSASLKLSLLNFLTVTPFFTLEVLSYLFLLSPLKSIFTSIYVAITSLVIIALRINYKCALFFLFLNLPFLLIDSEFISTSYVMLVFFVLAYMFWKKLKIPQVIIIKRFGFFTLSPPYIILCLILPVLFIVTNIFYPEEVYYVIIPPQLYSMGYSSWSLNIWSLFKMAIMAIMSFIPIVVNLAARYIDSYLWYIRVFRKMPGRVRFLNHIMTVSIGFIVPILALWATTLSGVVITTGLFSFCSLGTLIGILVPVSIEKDSEVMQSVTLYTLLTGVLFLFFFEISFLYRQYIELIDIAVSSFLLLLIILIEELKLPLIFKLIMFKLGVSRE